MISESIGYLRKSEAWVKTLVIGGLLALFSFLLIPVFLVVGYFVRVLQATMRGEEEPPVFDEWGELFVDGLKALVIGVVYSLIPAIIAGAVLALGLGALAGGGDAAGAFGGFLVVLGGLMALVLGLVAAYITPAAVANFAETDRLGAGFDFGTLRPILSSGKYATAWVMAFAVLLVAGVVTGVLNVIPFLGFIVGAFVTFYAGVAAYYIIGTTWGEFHPVEMREEEETPEERPAI
ncbi:MAG: DUF4013 domain-containing protein [Halobacteriota archaeon]